MGLSNSPYVGASESKLLQLYQFYLSVDEIRRRLLNAQDVCERLLRELLEFNGMRSNIHERNEFFGGMSEPDIEDFLDSEDESEEEVDIDIDFPLSQWVTINYPVSHPGDYDFRGKRESFGGSESEGRGAKYKASDSSESTMTDHPSSEEETESPKHRPGIRKRRHSSCWSSSDELKKSRSNSAPWPFGPPKDPNSLTPKECLIHIEKKEHVATNKDTKISFFEEKLAAKYETPECNSVQPKSTNIPSNSHASNGSDENPMCEDSVATSLPSSTCYSGKNLVPSDQLKKRAHFSCQKTTVIAKTCEQCEKLLKFEKFAAKCRDCGATEHLECKEILLPSVPENYKPISDYTTSLAPMIVHVNETEDLGLKKVGIYAASGLKRFVKMLKENFIRGIGASNIPNNALCGTVKDFLQILHEPSVISLFSEHLNRLETLQESDQRSLCRVLINLPRPTRDTTAYMILHLQKVYDNPEYKIAFDSLAGVFGPIIIEYSTSNQDPSTMLWETMKQIAVMQMTMKLPKYLPFHVNINHENLVRKTRTSGIEELLNDPEPSMIQRSMKDCVDFQGQVQITKVF